MNSLLLLVSLFSSSCVARPISLFHLSFQEVPVRAAWSKPSDIRGVTPADTYPLVLKPYSFAPAVLAPPSWLYPAPIRESTAFGTRHQTEGAIPLFQPFLSSPFSQFLQFSPVTTTFYLSEPNTRYQHDPDDEIPYKKLSAAPLPAFIPIRDVQLADRRQQTKDAQPAPVIFTHKMKQDLSEMNLNEFIEIKSFPQQIGPFFDFRGENDLVQSAPGGIVKSGQPKITTEKFINSKVSDFLLANSAMRSGLSGNNVVLAV